MSRNERRELENASDLADKGRYDEAIAKLEVLKTSADSEIHDLALNFLADAYASTGRNADAEAMLRRSMDERGVANEGLGWQLAVLAPLLRRLGHADEAEETYRRALAALGPDDAELKAITLRNLAYLYWSTGRADKAREIYAGLPKVDAGFENFLSGQVMKVYVEPDVPD